VDTWSPCWYVAGADRAMVEARFGRGGPAGALLGEKIAGHTIGWVRASGLLWAEGHPADLIEGIKKSSGSSPQKNAEQSALCRADYLPDAVAELADALRCEGLPVEDGTTGWDWFGPEMFDRSFTHQTSGFAGVRRVDGTVDLRFGDGPEGLAVMAGVAALTSTMYGQLEVRQSGHDRAIETVYLRGHGGKRVLGRWYDKGVQTGECSRGTWLRAEDQRRYARDARRDARELTSEYVRSNFQRRFYPLWRAAGKVRVSGVTGLRDELVRLAEQKAITVAECERLCGWLLMSSRLEGNRIVVDLARLDGLEVDRKHSWRRRRLLRDLGLVLSDGRVIAEDQEVDLKGVIECVMEADGW